MLLIILLLIYNNSHTFDGFVDSHWTNNTELVIVSSHWNEDLNWLKSLPHPVVVCGKEGEETPAIPTNLRCKTPNVGYETSSYLKFIIEFYDELPNNVAFIHGHENSIHQMRDLKTILTGNDWKTNKYYSMNFWYAKRCITMEEESSKYIKYISSIWSEYFEKELGIPAPTYVIADCCAQFVLPRELIHRYPKDVYIKWYNLVTKDYANYNLSSKEIAMAFEWVWHLIYKT
jgi:hypothetical protein